MTDHIASERAIISALITNPAVLTSVTLTPDDFGNHSHSAIWSVALVLHDTNKPIDRYTLLDHLDERHHAAVESAADLAAWTLDNIETYAEHIQAAALRRRVTAAGDAIKHLAADEDDGGLTERVQEIIDRAVQGATAQSAPTMKDRAAAYDEARSDRPEATPTPWPEMNTLLRGGLRGGRLYVIGARPGIGKTAVALQIAHQLGNRGRVLFHTLEMSEYEISNRVYAAQARIPFDRLDGDTLTQIMQDQLNRWRDVAPQNIAIIDNSAATVWDVRNNARMFAHQGDLTGVVVDYLQLMDEPKGKDRLEKVSAMTRTLKKLALELDVPVIACSQLNRESEKRTDGRPHLSDLRESGSIEQDADVVILLNRDGSEMVLDLAKNRQGAPGLVDVQWQGEFMRAVS